MSGLNLKLNDEDDDDDSNKKTKGPQSNENSNISKIMQQVANNTPKMGDSEASINKAKNQNILTQSEEIDSNSLGKKIKPPEEIDEYEQEDIFIEEEEPIEPTSKVGKNLKNKVDSISIPNKYKAIAVLIVLAGLVYVLYSAKGGFNLMPDRSGSQTKVQSTKEVNSPATNQVPNTPVSSTDAAQKKLKSLFPKYEVVFDESHKVFNITGEEVDSTFKATADLTGKILTEESIPKNKVNAVIPSGEVDDNNVTIAKADYERSFLPFKVQKVNIDDKGRPSSQIVRYIVQYEKLPLRGKMPFIYAVIDETKEPLLIPVNIGEYTSLAEKGSTVIEVSKVTAFGVETFDNIQLVNWKQTRVTNSTSSTSSATKK